MPSPTKRQKSHGCVTITFEDEESTLRTRLSHGSIMNIHGVEETHYSKDPKSCQYNHYIGCGENISTYLHKK